MEENRVFCVVSKTMPYSTHNFGGLYMFILFIPPIYGKFGDGFSIILPTLHSMCQASLVRKKHIQYPAWVDWGTWLGRLLPRSFCQ